MRFSAVFAAAMMNWVPVEPVPITPTLFPATSRSSGQALVWTSLPSKWSIPGMSGMLVLASSPRPLTRYVQVNSSPAAVRTVQRSRDSSHAAPVTSVSSRMSFMRS